MPPCPAPPPTRLDRCWRLAYRLAYPLARFAWRSLRLPHRGALVAISVDGAWLLVRSSYRAEWNFPGGGVKFGESPAAAAVRETMEEIGLAITLRSPARIVQGAWDGRPDTVHFFEVALGTVPTLRLDNREVIDARFVRREELPGLALTGPVADYLRRVAGSAPRDEHARP